MKRVSAYVCFILFVFCGINTAYSKQNFVVSEKLSTDMVIVAIARGDIGDTIYKNGVSSVYNIKLEYIDLNHLEGIGVFQQGNQATVYIKLPYKEKGSGSQISTIQLIRFNSGKWFFPVYNVFLKN